MRRPKPPPRLRDRAPSSANGPALRIGTMLDLDISTMALDGDPLGHVGDYVVFVEGAIPGERVSARVLSANRKFARASVVQVLRRSPHRVTPRCKHFGPCGGCAWQHIAYEEQLRLKRQMLVSLLETLHRPAAACVAETMGLEGNGDARDPNAPWGFRNKVHFVLGPRHGDSSLTMGHYRRGSHDLIEAEECPVHPDAGNRAAFRARDALLRYGVEGTDDETPRGVVRHLVVRAGEKTRQIQTTIVATREDSRKLKGAMRDVAAGSAAPGGLHLNLHSKPGPFLFGRETTRLHGEERMLDEVHGTGFLISPRSFFQTSIRSAEILLKVVLSFVPDSERRPVLDLYAGAGLFSIPIARRGQRVVAVEENPVAIGDGIASLRFNKVPSGACRFVRSRVEDWLLEQASALALDSGSAHFGVVVVDPPREGCPPEAMRCLFEKLRPDRVIYVSCNPRALAEDLALAAKAGYKVETVQPIDMFPHTPHIEAVALLVRRAP